MKKHMLLTVLLISGVIFAQNIEPEYEIQGNLVKATYFHDNGKVKQVGFYKDGKVHGKWASFAENGAKISLGTFNNGEKTGKWLFWNDMTLNEVSYNDSRVVAVRKLPNEALVQRN